MTTTFLDNEIMVREMIDRAILGEFDESPEYMYQCDCGWYGDDLAECSVVGGEYGCPNCGNKKLHPRGPHDWTAHLT